MSYRDSEDFAKDTSPAWRFVRGMIRRVRITLTEGVKWQVLGQRGGKGGDATDDLVPYTGIGFYARPPSSGSPEGIVASQGGTKAQAIIATRDETTRAAACGDLEDGETAVYNDKAIIVVKANGTVEIRLIGGIAVELATKADLTALKAAIAGAGVTPNDGGATFKAAIIATLGVGWPVGTSVLKGQ